MNKVFLFGNVGKDPVIRTTDGGKKVASFSMATRGFKADSSDWHNIVLWEKLAELAEQYVKKGSAVIIEGSIQYRSYTDKDGVTKYITEIVGNSMHFTGKKESSPSGNNEGKWQKSGETVLDAASKTQQFRDELDSKELPF